jgi:hypothetical protein
LGDGSTFGLYLRGRSYSEHAQVVQKTNNIRKEQSMNPFINDPQARYQERLDEVEQRRLAKLARANSISWSDRLRVRIGERLIVLGEQLKAAARPAPQFD